MLTRGLAVTSLEAIALYLWLQNDFKDVEYTGSTGPKYTATDAFGNTAGGVFEAEAIDELYKQTHSG